MDNFEDRSHKVMSFMDQVKEIKDQEAQDQEFKNSTDYKLKCLDKNQKEAKGICLDKVFSKIYKDALPLNDDYKSAHADDLDNEFKDFIKYRCPQGTEYYVKEAIKKGSKFAKKLMESVEDIVYKEYEEKAKQVERLNIRELLIDPDNINNKISELGQDISLDDISQVIRDNVKTSVSSEIMRAKKEKEDIKNLESELASDINVRNESTINDILEFKGYAEKRTFEPTLFEGIMIGKLQELENISESGLLEPEYTYNALSEFTEAETLETEGEFEESVGKTLKDFGKNFGNNLGNSIKNIGVNNKSNREKLEYGCRIISVGIAANKFTYGDDIKSKLVLLVKYCETLDDIKYLEKEVRNIKTSLYGKKGSSEYKREIDSLITWMNGIYQMSINQKKKDIQRKQKSLNESADDVATTATVEELAFIESVKELTKFNIIKALKLERFSLSDIRDIANEYAYIKA